MPPALLEDGALEAIFKASPCMHAWDGHHNLTYAAMCITGHFSLSLHTGTGMDIGRYLYPERHHPPTMHVPSTFRARACLRVPAGESAPGPFVPAATAPPSWGVIFRAVFGAAPLGGV